MNKKKIIALCLILVLGVIAIGGATLAYFTDTAAETNTIVVGNVSAELYESKYHRGATPDKYLFMTGQPVPLDDATIVADDATYHEDYLKNATLMPFNLKSAHRVQSMFEECTVAKNAYVQNTSKTNDCFVRIRYKVPEAVAQYLDIFYTDTQFITASDAVATADARTLDNTDKTEPMITTVTSSGTNFTLQGTTLKDGYYVAEFIYAERLTPGEFTQYSPVSKVTLVPSVTEDTITSLSLTDRQFDVLVEADIIQADGFLNAVEAFNAFDGIE